MNPLHDTCERIEILSIAELRSWLEAHHDQRESVWLITRKRASGEGYVARGDVLDELLCFGWTDGRMMRLDDSRSMQLISPRRVDHWAKSYKDRVERLEREGRMHPAGLASVARSKAAGLWNEMNDVDALCLPDELARALEDADAGPRFAALPPSYRRNLLRWIHLAKTSPTRDKRIAAIVAATVAGIRIPQM